MPAPAASSRRRWLLLVHQLPATPSNLRVRTWRRLQELGAIPVKQAVYALPDTPESREDFEWLRVEIEGSGGEAVIFSADHMSSEAEAALVEEFRRARQTAYTELAAELQRVRPRTAARSQKGRDRDLSRYRERFKAIERIDFFGSAGRDRVAQLLTGLESRSFPDRDSQSTVDDSSQFHGRLWVTRPRPGVDRMSSAWLIKRFIDPSATFDFVTDARSASPGALPFDMYGGGFGHDGDRCTFETLVLQFGIKDQAVARLGESVHDLDLKDSKFKAPEAATLGAAIDGLQMACSDDHRLLEQGMVLFEAMYRSFAQQARPSGPLPVARRRATRPK
jgi:hypothetical protein